MIDEKFKDKIQLAQNILKDRPEISRTHLARLVHADSKRISAWEQAGYLKFQTQIGGWKRYKWSINRRSLTPRLAWQYLRQITAIALA